MNVFGTVKTSINTREAAVRYGVEVNRHGKALCPFHNDRHPSLFVDDDHYYCYACGEYGDVIDFTSKLHGLSLYDAAKKLAYDFGITQDKPPTKEMQEKLNKKSEAQRLRENEKLCFSALMEYYKLLQEWMVLCAAKNTGGRSGQQIYRSLSLAVLCGVSGGSADYRRFLRAHRGYQHDDDRWQAEKATRSFEKA